MYEQNGSNKEETKRNRKEILERKSTITEMKYSLGFKADLSRHKKETAH